MPLRRFLARAQAALLSMVEWLTTSRTPADEANRWQRMATRAEAQFELVAIKELSPVEAAEVAALLPARADAPAWKSGEQRAVPVPVTVLSYAEPIGPQPADPHEVFAADPLGAPLPGPAPKSNPHFAGVLRGRTSMGELHPEVAADMEKTGQWTAGYLAKLARGER